MSYKYRAVLDWEASTLGGGMLIRITAPNSREVLGNTLEVVYNKVDDYYNYLVMKDKEEYSFDFDKSTFKATYSRYEEIKRL